MIKILLVDDEPLAHQRMQALLGEFDDVQIVGIATSLQHARHLLTECQPDAVFLDVEMPGGTAFTLLPSIEECTDVVFVTAHDSHAVQAFAVGAVDYLVKPVSVSRLADAIDRVKLRRLSPPSAMAPTNTRINPEPHSPPRTSLSVPLRKPGQKAVVRVEEICWIEALRNYTRVALNSPSRLLVFRRRIGEWLPHLPSEAFARLSRSEVVQVAAIRGTEWVSRGETIVTFHGDVPPMTLGRISAQRLSTILDDAADRLL